MSCDDVRRVSFCECYGKMALWYGWYVLMRGEWCYFCDI